MESSHLLFMNKALSLAACGGSDVSPNPLVGCVIVKNGRVVGQGYHKRYGGPHAEVFALKQAGNRARGATMYLTLEPCSHWGKTPPCAPQVIAAGLKKVFVAMVDPNPLVKNKGLQALRRAGIQVQVGLEGKKAAALNRPFIVRMTHKRPYTILKMAMTLDGKSATASGDSKWITSAASRRLVHELRGKVDAVLIGARTAKLDNPHLTTHGHGKNPLRVVLDPYLTTPPGSRVFSDRQAPTLLFTSTKVNSKRLKLLEKEGVQILRKSLKNGFFELKGTLKNLLDISVNQLLIEGGGNTSWSFIQQNLVDEVWFFIAPRILGGRAALTPVEGAGLSSIRKAWPVGDLKVSQVGPDLLIKGTLCSQA